MFQLTSRYDANDPKQANETNDAYDTIDWLVKNVPNNNGRVGIYGVSYDGLTAGLTLLHPHPALKAVSEQASPVDQWMNDDMHRYGALRESYAFEYSVLEQADKNKNTHFDFDTYDTYEWYLKLGPLSKVNAKYLHGTMPFWNDMMEHPNYDAFWKREAWVNQLHSSTVPNLNVAGFWDQEDPWGPWQIFRHAAENDPGAYQLDGGRAVVSRRVADAGGRPHRASCHSAVTRPRSNSGRISRRLLPLLPARQGREAGVEGDDIPDRIEYVAQLCGVASKGIEADESVSACGWNVCRSTPHAAGRHRSIAQYVSDPANPVPYRARPISPTYPEPEWRTWEVADQRFVDHRPDVLTFVSAPLDHDVVVTGPVAGGVVCVDFGNGYGFRGEADRCVSGERAEERRRYCAGKAERLRRFAQRIRVADRDGSAARALSAQLRASRSR